MITPDLMQALQADLGRDLRMFSPELVLSGSIVLMLLLRLFRGLARFHLGFVALVLSILALTVATLQAFSFPEVDALRRLHQAVDPRGSSASLPMFTGLLVFDNFTIFLRLFLIFFAVLMVVLSMLTGIPDREDSADFYTLLFGATLGMCIMASSNHLLMVFLGVEMASLPSYALAGFLKGRRQSSEASLKYVVYGGGASGIMLYGISLLAGKFGTGSLPALGGQFATALASQNVDMVLVLGLLFVLIGLAFKLSAVPFHFWCPDVFEGASAEVAGFLSVASKGAALALLGRFCFTLCGLDGLVQGVGVDWMTAVKYLAPILAVLAAVTATFGNLAAYFQTNLKRLLAYSTIAHAGYMIMGFVPMTREGAGAVLFYLVTYLFTNLGAFAVVAFLRNLTGSEDLSSFRGLIRRAPALVIVLAVCLLSLLGLPPLAGFVAKFQIFRVLYDGGQSYAEQGWQGLSVMNYAMLVVLGVNTVVSVVYYLKVLKVMILETTLEEVEGRPSSSLIAPPASVAFASILAIAILVLGLLWDPVARASAWGVNRFHKTPGTGGPVAAAGDPTEVTK